MKPSDVAANMVSLLTFAETMFMARKGASLRRNWHQDAICNALERVVIGDCKRLIINIPPRSGKTEFAVVNFIAWCMGNWPDSEFIHASYSKRIAAANAYAVRHVMAHETYQEIFPHVVLADDSKAKDEFRTEAGGLVYATGADGSITGVGAGKMRDVFGGAIVIDDPHKAGEANSEVMRANVRDWFTTTMESRKNNPDTPIIIIMQRLHESDLAGWLLNGGNGEEWEHLNIPALTNDGGSFWEAQFPLATLRRMEQAAPYVFAGQYMQRPAPLDGGVFKPGMLQVIDALPAERITWVRGWDFGATDGGDPTAGAKIGRLPDGRLIIADMVHGQWGPDERDAVLRNTASQDGYGVRISLPQDPGQAGKTQALYMTRMLQGYRVHTSPESGDKVTRAEPFAAQVNVGNVLMLRGSWNNGLIEEMRMFPNGKHDDRIDACSRAFAELIARRPMVIDADLIKKA